MSDKSCGISRESQIYNILDQLDKTKSVKPTSNDNNSKCYVSTPNVITKIAQMKKDTPSMSASSIRERLLNKSICTQDNLPSVSSINRMLRRASPYSTGVTADFQYQTKDFYFNKLLNPSSSTHDTIENNDEQNMNISSKQEAKRHRILFTKEQYETLEKEFEHAHYLDNSVRKQLSETLHLDEYRIRTWFTNRRVKWHYEEKKQKKQISIDCEPSTSNIDIQSPVSSSESTSQSLLSDNIIDLYSPQDHLSNNNQHILNTPIYDYSCLLSPVNSYEDFSLYYPSDYSTFSSNTVLESSTLDQTPMSSSSTYSDQC